MTLNCSALALGTYTMTDIGASVPAAVNNKGQVVGISSTPGHVFLYTPGVGMVQIDIPGDIRSNAADINDNGDVVGNYQRVINGNQESGVFRFSIDRGFQVLEGLANADARAINNNGQVSGVKFGNSIHTFRYTDGKDVEDLHTGVFTDLQGKHRNATEILATFSLAMNSKGDVAGNVVIENIPGSLGGIFLYTDETGPRLLGTFGQYPPGYASGINDLGQVAGAMRFSSDPSQSPHAFLFTEGAGFTDLGF